MKLILTSVSALILLGGCASIGEVNPHAEGQSKHDAALSSASSTASTMARNASGQVLNTLPGTPGYGSSAVYAASTVYGADVHNAAVSVTGAASVPDAAALAAAANLLSVSNPTCTSIYQNYAAAKALIPVPEAAESKFSLGGIVKTALSTTSSVMGIAGAFSGGSTPTKLAAASAGLSGATNLMNVFGGGQSALHSATATGAAITDGPVNIKEIAVARAFAMSCPLDPIING